MPPARLARFRQDGQTAKDMLLPHGGLNFRWHRRHLTFSPNFMTPPSLGHAAPRADGPPAGRVVQIRAAVRTPAEVNHKPADPEPHAQLQKPKIHEAPAFPKVQCLVTVQPARPLPRHAHTNAKHGKAAAHSRNAVSARD